MKKWYGRILAGTLVIAMLFSMMSLNMLTLEGKQTKENSTETAEAFDSASLNREEKETSAENETSSESEPASEAENSPEETKPEGNGDSGEIKEPEEPEKPEDNGDTAETNKPEGNGNTAETKKPEEEESLKNGSPAQDTASLKEQTEEENNKIKETEKSENDTDAQETYTLHVVHTLRYKKNGKGLHVQGHKAVKLTHKDFKDGGYDSMKQAYVHEALTAALAPGYPDTISESDFRDDGKGGKEFDIEIRYTLKEGWNVRFPGDKGYGGSTFYGVYEGAFEDAEFIPAKHITLTIQYKYSSTGDLAGADAHTPDVIDLLLKDDGTADLADWRVPHYEKENTDYHGHSHDNLEGFRIVLDPEPLNRFVKNPDGNLEDGDFDLRDDVDTASQEYQEAWDAARKKTAAGESGKEVLFSYIAPAENGGTSQTTTTDPDKMYCLNASGLTEDLTLTVYYRRDVGTYTVNHWKPKEGVTNPVQGNAADWVPVIDSQVISGRAGTLTKAKPLSDASVTGYVAAAFSQETIKPDGSTVIQIYYMPETIRVVFDTDDIYIERQQVPLDGYVELGTDEDKLAHAKPGYRFGGWQYRPAGGKEDDREDLHIPPEDAAKNRFRLTQDFLNAAWIDNSAEAEGIQVLRLYPKWEPDTTTVRVVLWTENLNGQDVEVTKYNYNFNTKQKVPASITGGIVHQTPGEGDSFSNAGSFEMKDTFHTGDKLVENGELVSALQTQITAHLDLMGSVTVSGTTGNPSEVRVPVSDFYEQCQTKNGKKGFHVLVENVGKDGAVTEEETETAAANGSTLVYVYFTRKVYRLNFDYFYQMPHEKVSGAQEGAAQIITETSWFSNPTQWNSFENGSAYPDSGFQNVSAEEIGNNHVPMTTAISAKYGADLRGVWPADDESRYLVDGRLRVSWATTRGLHNSHRPGGNVNVPGAYSTMSAAIVADTENNQKIHHLVAFWTSPTNNTYRYNYCYEVPELTAEEVSRCKSIKIFKPSSETAEEAIRNTIYLVPADHKAFLKYGFTDLLKLNELEIAQKADTSDPVADPENYYVIRIYNGKCYAVSRQLVAMSALAVEAQNPSARPHLTLVNTRSDHSTEVSGQGSADKGYDNYNNPYDVYFYYTRERFTITYMSDETTEVGQLELPYGTALSEKKYAYDLDYRKTNKEYAEPDLAGGWSLFLKKADGSTTDISPDLSVCPKRSANGTKPWKFNGWALGPAGVRMMQWNAGDGPVLLESNLRLYAVWEAPQYKVTFDWNHGSFINPQDAEQLKEQLIPGNRSFINHGVIPRPFRDKFMLSGWIITARGDAEGNKTETVPNNGTYPRFLFEQPVTQDLWVKAVWESTQEMELSYTIHYLVQDTETPVRDPKTVTGTYLPGTSVWASPEKPTKEGYENYIPLTQNQSVVLSADEENKIVFYYAPPLTYQYTVKYNIWNTQETVLELTEKTDKISLQVYPTKDHIGQLNELGYYVVDIEGKRAEKGEALAETISPAAEEETVTYYVLPDTYTITYQNMELMGKENIDALHNPATYTTAEGAGRLNNPTGTYTDARGNKVQFAGWRMVNTREVSGIRDFENGREIAQSVTIEKGSRGNLIFSAVWNLESGIVPPPSGDPENPNTPGKVKKPKTPVQSGSGGGSGTAVTSPSPGTSALGLPQTGAAWWLVCLLALLGTFMLAGGLFLKRYEKG